MKPLILAGLTLAGLACSEGRVSVASPAAPHGFPAPEDNDRKFDSSLAVLIGGYRTGSDAGAEAAAKRNFIAWNGPVFSVDIAATSPSAAGSVALRTREAGAEVVRVEGGVVFARATLPAVDRIAQLPSVGAIALSVIARPHN